MLLGSSSDSKPADLSENFTASAALEPKTVGFLYIRRVCGQFVVLCQQLGLFSEALVAIDGSKFKAVNNRDRNFTSAKLQRRMEEIESSISRYLAALDTADRQEPSVAQAKAERLQDKIAALKVQMKALKEIEVQLNEAPDKQISLTDLMPAR